MKNLKRVLSLGLASVMLLGMMVVGASAKDFTDAEDIVHDEAVEVMVALKIINGKEDGSYFAPKDNVTRGEMAKMIAVMMNGGSEANTGVKTTPSFTDIGGHWAEGWIEYCADMKIINGRGDGTFAPNDNVTGVEALKMVLTALGYNAEAYHLQGAAWASQTLERARITKGCKLTEGLDDVTMTEPATRDVAAQMIWNGLQACVVTNEPDQNTNSGEVTWNYREKDTILLNQRYNAYVATGTYVGNHDYNGNGALKGEITVSFANKSNSNDNIKLSGNYSFPSDMSIDNIAEEVKVVWKNGNRSSTTGPDKNDIIYGVFNTGATRVVRSQLSKINSQESSKTRISIDGTLYDTTNRVVVEVNYAQTLQSKIEQTVVETDEDGKEVTKKVKPFALAAYNGETVEEASDGKAKNSELTSTLKKNSGTKLKAIFDDNGKINKIYVTESYLGVVTGTNSTTISINNGPGNLKFEDNDIEEGLKRGDVVVITPLYDTTYGGSKMVVTVKKAEKVSGELTAYKCNHDDVDDKKEDESLTIGGKTYKVNYKNVDGGKLNKSFKSLVTLPKEMPEVDGDPVENFYSKLRGNDYIGEDFDLYLVDGYVAAAVQTSESASNYSVITEVKKESEAGGTFGKLQLQVMGADGTKEIITVADESKVFNNKTGKSLSHKTDRTDNKNITSADYRVGDIITYTFNNNDEAEVNIKGLVADEADGLAFMSYDEKAKTVTYEGADGKKVSTPTTGDALFFTNVEDKIAYKDFKMAGAEWAAYNLRSLDEIKNEKHDGHVTVALNGDGDRVVAVFANLATSPDGAGDDDVYGIVSGYNGRVKDYYVYTVQANGEEYEIKYKGTNSDDLAKGDLVRFNPTADNTYKPEKVLTMEELGAKKEYTWVVGWASELKDDVLVYYVDGEVDNKTTTGNWEVVKDENGDKVKAHSYALDKDAKIIYIDQSTDKSATEETVTAFSSVTGKQNVGFLLKETTNDNGSKRQVIVALFFETSNKKDVDD